MNSFIAFGAIRLAGHHDDAPVWKCSRRWIPAWMSHVRQHCPRFRVRIKDVRGRQTYMGVDMPPDDQNPAVRHLFLSTTENVRWRWRWVDGVSNGIPDYSCGAKRLTIPEK